jgi:hypothetical protein
MGERGLGLWMGPRSGLEAVEKRAQHLKLCEHSPNNQVYGKSKKLKSQYHLVSAQEVNCHPFK